MTRSSLSAPISLLLALAAASVIRVTSAAATTVCGSLGDTTWTAADSPYSVCTTGATVTAGATLTIEPGVVVQFQASAGNKLNVQGTLSAVGTAEQPITFTGESNTAGSWAGLSIDGATSEPAVATLRSVVVEYGGVNGSYGAAISVDRGVLTLAHAIVRNGAGSGLYATYRSAPTLDDTTFSDNGLDAVRLANPGGDLPFTNLAANGNGLDAVHVTGTNVHVSGERRWTAPGLPLVIDTLIGNAPGDVLTIDPGNELRFGVNSGLEIGGRLDAIGAAAEPILMTAQTAMPGGWRGIYVDGGTSEAIAHLEQVTLDYGGGDTAGADLEVANGRVIASHDIIRNARVDGVRVDSNATVSIQNSQITGNGRYGVNNGQPSRPVLATNNWWGDASGPQSDSPTCSSGTGQRITDGVLFHPVLTDPAGVVPVPLSAVPMITMAPRRWFAPADGVTRVYVDVTVRDGNGTPLPGRTLRLHSTLGTVVDGGITDADGKTLAYLTSNSTGDAQLVASLDVITCENALSPTARVTFTTPLDLIDLFPDSPAPYLSSGITITPHPIVTGVPETISATLVNPEPSPITVDVHFGFVQSSIGLAFGPIMDFTGQVIPAGASLTLQAPWVPTVSGHYCFQVTYNVTAAGASAARDASPGGGEARHNENTQQGPESSTDGKGRLDKTRNAVKWLSKVPAGAQTKLQGVIVDQGLGAEFGASEWISGNLIPDPPRQDYQQLDAPQTLLLPPVQPGEGLSAARAAALTAVHDAMAEVNAQGRAAITAFDRYGGASEAHDLTWASLQSAALIQYKQQMGEALIVAAGKIDDLLNVAASEGDTSVPISRDDIIAMQRSVAAGFSADQIAAFRAVGLTDAEIEDLRQETITADPDILAGDLVTKLQAVRDAFLGLGDAFTRSEIFAPSFSVSGGAGRALVRDAAPGNSLVHLYDTTTTDIVLGNPLGTVATIDVRARRIDLPADWAVDVSPAQVTLEPGAQTPVTVTIVAGSPLPQGSNPRAAVEGWAGTQLLGGVLVDIVAPRYTTPPDTTPCTGDCDGNGSVTIDEIITMVNMALGNAGSCPNGVPAGAPVDVSMIVTAVNHALNGCGGG